ncbi:MAG: hydroxyacid dehydrogenase [Candidatus Ranarchaeia archaeon]
MPKPNVAIVIGKRHYKRMMNKTAWEKLEAISNVIHHEGEDPATKEDLIKILKEADAVINSWGVAKYDFDVLAAATRLKMFAHMGGSVKRFISEGFWERGIRITSASVALGEDVAMTTLGIMIVGMKKIFPLSQRVREGGWRDSPVWPARELKRKTVGIIAAGNVGRRVIKLLEPFSVRILVFDPYLTDEAADSLGVEKVGLDELLRQSDVVSLHAPSLPSTHHILNASNLPLLKDRALLINTARGSLIDEEALIKELETGRIEAWLDVTDPEPPAKDSPLRRLPNVVLSPHIAGCIEDCSHMGELAVEEIRRFFAGEPPINAITRDRLDSTA